MAEPRSVEPGEDEMAVTLKRRRFTLEEYHRLGETGIINEDERVELVEGDIVEMSPIGWPHASVVARLTMLFATRFADRAITWVQGPLALPRQVSQFQPDLALLKPQPDFYRRAGVGPDDAFLVVEVMDSTVAYDRRVKLPIYARGGVPEVWLVDVNRNTIEVYRDPTADGYREHRLIDAAGTVSTLAFPDVVFAVRDLVG
jgi:Uma2 family endonuclease